MVREEFLEQLKPLSRLKEEREGFTLVELSSKCPSFQSLEQQTEGVWIEKANVFEQIQTQQEPWQKETETSTESVKL